MKLIRPTLYFIYINSLKQSANILFRSYKFKAIENQNKYFWAIITNQWAKLSDVMTQDRQVWGEEDGEQSSGKRLSRQGEVLHGKV